MKRPKQSGFNTPFQNLPGVLKSRVESEPVHPSEPVPSKPPPEAEDDVALFLNAMDGVKPIQRKNVIESKIAPSPKALKENCSTDDKEALDELKRLIDNGQGFHVSSTPEYMEGRAHNVHPEISKKLHRGKFSVEAHIDLHGMTVAEAQVEFDDFLMNSITNGLRTLLVIHGRGLSSINKPILKSKVYEWLTSGPWRKWVIAFSSARSVDGGAGATCILLRKSPVPGKFRKKHKK